MNIGTSLVKFPKTLILVSLAILVLVQTMLQVFFYSCRFCSQNLSHVVDLSIYLLEQVKAKENVYNNSAGEMR